MLDTCTFLWILSDSPRLSEPARAWVRNPESEVFLSAVSAWEIGVKHGLGRLPLPSPPTDFVPAMREAHGLAALPLDEESTLYISRLPHVHRDPFDRMLVCQALVHDLTILTPDELVRQYPVKSRW